MIISETAQAGMMAMAVHIREYLIQKQAKELQSQKSPAPQPTIQR